MPDIFISYSSKDKFIAEKIYSLLSKNGYEVWWDVNEVLVGHDITDKVYEGLMTSKFLIIILTHNSVKSKWVAQELNYVKTKEIEKGGVSILPLKFDDCEIPASISTKRWADFRESFSSGANELLKALSTYFYNEDTSIKQSTIIKSDGIPISPFPSYLYPSILIGIGGFGTRIMTHVKNKIEIGAGSSDLPIIKSMVMLDTDQSFLLKGVHGQITRLPTDLPYDFVTHILSKPASYPHISSWLADELKMILNNVSMGSAMIRAIGRLCLFNNLNKIIAKIKNSVYSITDMSSVVHMHDKFGIKTSLDTLYFYLIASTCGGTGSGQIIDLAYIIRSLFPDARIIAYLGLPEAFPHLWNYANPKLFSNTFAFLKELEYFNVSGNFKVSWDGNQEFQSSFPPFDNVYLFSAINEASVRFNYDQMFDKIAGHILLAMDKGYSGEYWRSKDLNKESILSNKIGESNNKSFSCRYSTFGLSGLQGNLKTKEILNEREILQKMVVEAFPLLKFTENESRTGVKDGFLKYGILTTVDEIYERQKVVKAIEEFSGVPLTAVESDPIGLILNIEKIGFPLKDIEFLNNYGREYNEEIRSRDFSSNLLHIFENAITWNDPTIISK